MLKSFFKIFAVLIFGIACGAVAVFAYQTIASSFASAATVPVAAPTELIIPAIHLDAPVVSVGVNAQGDLGVPSDAIHVAWYKNGPRPGAPGVAVIDGHLDTKNSPQAVFYNLDELRVGNEINVQTADGTTVVFTVTGSKTISYDASTTSLFYSSSTAPQLVLITCTGDWVPAKKIYNQRLVVFAKETAK